MPSRKAAREAGVNADQLEAAAVADGTVPLINALNDDVMGLDDLAERYGAARSPDGNSDWEVQDSAQERAIGDLQLELDRRRTLLGDRYPYRVTDDGNALEYLPDACPSRVYEFCLALSTLHPGDRLHHKPEALAPRAFERLVGRLLAAYLGAGAEFYRLGWPPENDRPGTMRGALRELRQRTREWEITPPSGADAPADQGDGGIDLVVWRRFGSPVFDPTIDPPPDGGEATGDARLGMLVLLAQCACGDDWPGKRKDLCLTGFGRRWPGVISFAGQIRCMAIPHHVHHLAEWRDSCEAGILLDRVRVTWLAGSVLTPGDATDVATVLAPHLAALRAPPPEPKIGPGSGSQPAPRRVKGMSARRRRPPAPGAAAPRSRSGSTGSSPTPRTGTSPGTIGAEPPPEA